MTGDAPIKTRTKLIEVALPLDAINKAAGGENRGARGHPNTLHKWWARRPLAAARAVIFAQMVDDPSAVPELFPTEAEQERERERLFGIIEELVLWESTTNEDVLERAREEIRRSWRRACADNAGHPRAQELFDPQTPPVFHDPFAGGGALPLEAQRLGLETYASDLNPVAVLINKAMNEIPPKFSGQPPINPESCADQRMMDRDWRGTEGLAEDARYYGKWMRDEAERRIGHLYPKVSITEEMARERPDLERYVGRELTVIAWLWARTVKSPNPAFADVDVPLATTFVLSKRRGKEAWVEPVIEGREYRFNVRAGTLPDTVQKGTEIKDANFRCLLSGTPIPPDYIKAEGIARRMSTRLLAIVAYGDRQRIYLEPTPEHELTASDAVPMWRPEGIVPTHLTGGSCVPYGLDQWGKLFTNRQLVGLTTFTELVPEARAQIERDAVAAGLSADGTPLREAGSGARAYAEAVATLLGLAVSKAAESGCSIARWQSSSDKIAGAFGRQAIPMVWDFAEANFFSSSSRNWFSHIDWIASSLLNFPSGPTPGTAFQADAMSDGTDFLPDMRVVSTDPPYYNNINYADLSDFFYVWLRRTLSEIFPDLFATLVTPKREELVATPYRHGSKQKADEFFVDGMRRALARLAGREGGGVAITSFRRRSITPSNKLKLLLMAQPAAAGRLFYRQRSKRASSLPPPGLYAPSSLGDRMQTTQTRLHRASCFVADRGRRKRRRRRGANFLRR